MESQVWEGVQYCGYNNTTHLNIDKKIYGMVDSQPKQFTYIVKNSWGILHSHLQIRHFQMKQYITIKIPTRKLKVLVRKRSSSTPKSLKQSNPKLICESLNS